MLPLLRHEQQPPLNLLSQCMIFTVWEMCPLPTKHVTACAQSDGAQSSSCDGIPDELYYGLCRGHNVPLLTHNLMYAPT